MAYELWSSGYPKDMTLRQLLRWLQNKLPNVRALVKTAHFQAGGNYIFILTPDLIQMAVHICQMLHGSVTPDGSVISCDFSMTQQAMFKDSGLELGEVPSILDTWTDPMGRGPELDQHYEPPHTSLSNYTKNVNRDMVGSGALVTPEMHLHQ